MVAFDLETVIHRFRSGVWTSATASVKADRKNVPFDIYFVFGLIAVNSIWGKSAAIGRSKHEKKNLQIKVTY